MCAWALLLLCAVARVRSERQKTRKRAAWSELVWAAAKDEGAAGAARAGELPVEPGKDLRRGEGDDQLEARAKGLDVKVGTFSFAKLTLRWWVARPPRSSS